ncbi:MAG TPA: hypothetical protein VKA68_03980, partial [bacterium]|nr:hypothetical protein [bacterium]
MATRVIPGVDVEVVREVVPPLPTPSGILAVVGTAEKAPAQLQHVDSYPRFKQVYGVSSSFTLPEVRQAFYNGIFEVVVSPAAGGDKASLTLNDAADDPLLIFEARAAGSWGNNIRVNVKENANKVDITITYQDRTEEYKNLDLEYGSRNYLFDVINRQSELVAVR